MRCGSLPAEASSKASPACEFPPSSGHVDEGEWVRRFYSILSRERSKRIQTPAPAKTGSSIRGAQSTNSTLEGCGRNSARRAALKAGYSSDNRKAASAVMRAEESSIPLQSGNWISRMLLTAAGSADFLVEFFGSMLQKQFPNRRGI